MLPTKLPFPETAPLISKMNSASSESIYPSAKSNFSSSLASSKSMIPSAKSLLLSSSKDFIS